MKRSADDTTTRSRKRRNTTTDTDGTDDRLPRKYNEHGVVLTMGQGDMAQLGLGSERPLRKKPTVVAELTEIVHVTAGAMHGAALTVTGDVWSWGNNDEGAVGRAMGDDGDDECWTPEKVVGFDAFDRIVDVIGGCSHTVALADTGRVYSWGVYRDNNGTVGHTKDVDKQMLPKSVEFFDDKRHRATMIAAGEHHDVAVTGDNAVYQWGDVNVGHRKSRRLRQSYLVPHRVLIPRRQRVARVYSTGYTNFLAMEGGRLYAWGLNNRGQTGIGHCELVSEPTHITSINDDESAVVDVAGGTHHTLFLCANHSVWSVGENTDGRLGLGDTQPRTHVCRVNIAMTDDDDYVVRLGGGSAVSMAITRKGALYSWGYGDLLQLGHTLEEKNYTWVDVLTPRRVESRQLTEIKRRVLAASCGAQHSILLAAE